MYGASTKVTGEDQDVSSISEGEEFFKTEAKKKDKAEESV